MRINSFFIALALLFAFILFFFQPLKIKEQNSGDVPLFTLASFTMYELDAKGLVTTMQGESGTRYKNRYVVETIDYTDNSKELSARMQSKNGVYKNDIVYLEGAILYQREDGLTFETQKATYNKKTSVAIAEGEYLLYKGENRVSGRALHYNSALETINSQDVTAKYQIEEKKR